MSSVAQFLSRLQSLNLSLKVDGDRLICQAPKHALTPELREELAARKSEILEFLRSTCTDAPRSQSSQTVLSRAQRRLWFLDQLDPANPVYNVAIALDLQGPLDHAALEESLREIVTRHEVLRLRIENRGGEPHANLSPASEWKWECEAAADWNSAQDRAREIARAPFDLNRGPLFRARLIQGTASRHLLALCMHHSVSDGWSIGLLSRELSALYTAHRDGRPTTLAPLTHSYADYARWEQQASERGYDRDLHYWRQQLGGELPIVEIPAVRTRPTVITYRGRRSRLLLDRHLSESVRALSRNHGATPFMVLLAAFQMLLSNYTGLEDLPVGTATAGRTREEFTSLIGLFVNTLVMRADLSGDPRFIELLARVRRTAMQAYEHQAVPFDQVVECVQPQRDLSHSPLCQVMFTLQNVPLPAVEMPGLNVELVEIEPEISRYDLSIEVWDRPDGYRCDFEYSTDLFDEPFIARLKQHFSNLIKSIVDNPECRLSELTMLNDEETQQLVHKWNQSASPYPPFANVPAWFRFQAQRRPDAEAVRAGVAALTYKQLDERSAALAAHLHAHGVSANVVVGICLDRHPDLVVAMLAILRAGGAYLPLDPALPPERLAYVLQDSRTPLVITEEKHRGLLAGLAPQLLCVDSDLEPQIEFTAEPDGNDTAYLLYTSGSTGRPKGVAVSHRSLLNLLASIQREPGMIESDTFLAISAFSFDIASAELLLPLVTGARVVLAQRDEVLNVQALSTLIDDCNATVMQATPSGWRMLVEGGWLGKRDLKLWTAGEPLTAELAAELHKRGMELWNLYGPTETTIYSTVHRVLPGEDPVLIGRPVANTRLYILGPKRQVMPVGIPGELFIAGGGVAQGYWRQPALTAERFASEASFTGQDGPMYQTGDLARYDSQGRVQLLGRLDHQVKLRGYRIELGEIEESLSAHPDVWQAAVVLQGEGSYAKLIAYVAADRESPAELRAWLQSRLPEYMVPTAFVFLHSLPLTPSGKVDRRRLQGTRLEPSATTRKAPRTSIEQALAAIWSDILHIADPGIDDGFFELGGHSLLLVKAHERIRREIDESISIADLFAHPTIASLAALLERKSNPMTMKSVSAHAQQ